MINELVNNVPTFNKSNPNNLFPSFKKTFGSEVSYENKCTIFYDELKKVSKSKGLGDNISVQTVYEENIPEKVFTISIEHHLSKSDKYVLLEEITNSMSIFAKKSMLWDFFKDSYIIIK
jgi:hypothetical protein